MSADDDEHITLIEDCENRESRLSDWERTFINSIRNQIEEGHSLTDRQAETLDTVWNRVTARG